MHYIALKKFRLQEEYLWSQRGLSGQYWIIFREEHLTFTMIYFKCIHNLQCIKDMAKLMPLQKSVHFLALLRTCIPEPISSKIIKLFLTWFGKFRHSSSQLCIIYSIFFFLIKSLIKLGEYSNIKTEKNPLFLT